MVGFYCAVEDSYMSCGAIFYLLEIMGHHDKQLISGDLAQQLDYLGGGSAVKITRRLVCENYGAILGKCAGDYRSLLLSARKTASLLVYMGRKSNSVKQFKRSSSAFFLIFYMH